MKRILGIALLVPLVIALQSGPSFEFPEEPGTMLADCYRAVCGAANGAEYHEFVLSTGGDHSFMILDEYRMDEEADSEAHASYKVPADAARQCCRLIESAGFRTWEYLEDPVSMDGILLVCRFYDQGTYIRVSSEAMPQDGERLLEGIYAFLESLACEEYLIGSR